MSTKHNETTISNARDLRKNMTREERKLWYEFLKDYDVKFRRQYPADPFIIDFYCPKAKMGVELDGGGHYTDEKKRYDVCRSEALAKRGIDIYRYSNLDVKRNFYGVCSDIDRKVRERMAN